MLDKARLVLGGTIVLVSLFLFLPLGSAFFLVTMMGWTTDNPARQTVLEHIGSRLLVAILLFLNFCLLYSGIRICRNTLNIISLVLLIIGLIPMILFRLI